MRQLRGLVWAAIVGAVALPAMLAVTLGLGLLLEALGDETGWQWCARIALAIAAFWVVAVAATAVGGAILAVTVQPKPWMPRSGPPHPGDTAE